MSSWMPSSADYIIVGGGVAGCTLASRLSHGDPDSRVVLIEAGQDPAGHPFTSTPAAAISTHFSDLDWAYTTVSSYPSLFQSSNINQYGLPNQPS